MCKLLKTYVRITSLHMYVGRDIGKVAYSSASSGPFVEDLGREARRKKSAIPIALHLEH